MNHVSSFAFNAGVDIHDTKLSNLVKLSYAVASRNLLRCFITAVLQASGKIPCCRVYRSRFNGRYASIEHGWSWNQQKRPLRCV